MEPQKLLFSEFLKFRACDSHDARAVIFSHFPRSLRARHLLCLDILQALLSLFAIILPNVSIRFTIYVFGMFSETLTQACTIVGTIRNALH